MKAFRNWGGIITLTGAAMFACFTALISMPSLRGPYVVPFLFYFALAALSYTIAALRLRSDRPPLWIIWSFALLFRLPLLATQPTLSDDVYRYIWDGHLLNQGINPYSHSVDAPTLDAATIPQRELVNHDWMASPYLPAAQLLFALVERAAPGSILAFQITAVLLDLATGWLVMDLLGTLQLPRRRVLLYLWNPLVVVEFAHGAHIDIWMIALTVLSFWLISRARRDKAHHLRLITASAIALGTAALTKGIPVFLSSLLLRRWGLKRLILFGITVLGTSALFALDSGWGLTGPLDGTGLFGALRIYLHQWNYNSGLYHWLETSLAGYPTPGAVPLEPSFEASIRLAKLIVTALLGLITLGVGLWAWRLDDPEIETHNQRTLALLRLAALLIGAYLMLTTTLHPWYVTLILPFIPFLLPADGESPALGRFLWPWLYLSCAVAFSYVTYIDPNQYREFALVRQIEYVPFYALLLWSIWSYFASRIRLRNFSQF